MKLLTKNTDYAIRALITLSRDPEKYVSARQVAQEQDVPYEYLRKIFQQLLKGAFIESKGKGRGGFRMCKNPAEIKMVDVIRVFQGGLQLSDCMFRKNICANRARCVLRKNILRIEQVVNKEFEGITIQSLLDEIKTEK